MPVRLVALDEGPDITLDRTMVVVGRHPNCDTRLDSLRVSRHHCCMTQESGEVVVRDLGSTNGIRINGQRVEIGRLRPGDELSIAHIRYRLENGQAHEQTIAEPAGLAGFAPKNDPRVHPPIAGAPLPPPRRHPPRSQHDEDNPLAAAVRKYLPAGLADKCRIQVIVQMPEGEGSDDPEPHRSALGPCPGATRGMSFQLVPLSQGAAPVIALQRPVVLIGRHLDCDARIESAKVSRRHCYLAMAYDRVILRDLGSRNGVRVNGRIVEEVRLQPGDEVAIGPILYRFEGVGAAAVGPSPPGGAARPAPPDPAHRPSRARRRPPATPAGSSTTRTSTCSRSMTSDRPGPRRTSRLFAIGRTRFDPARRNHLRRNGFCVPCASRRPLC